MESEEKDEERDEWNTKFSDMPQIGQGGWHIQRLAINPYPNRRSNINTSMGEEANRRKQKPSKRVHERVDGLQHLVDTWPSAPLTSLVDRSPSGKEGGLQRIVYGLVSLNIIIMIACYEAQMWHDWSVFDWKEDEHFAELLPEAEREIHQKFKAGQNIVTWWKRVSDYSEGLSKEGLLERVQDLKTHLYISRALEHLLNVFRTRKSQKNLLDNSKDHSVPEAIVDELNALGLFREKGGDYCLRRYKGARDEVLSIYNIALDLRMEIANATSFNLLDEVSLSCLKAKMSALQEHFHEACDELGKPRQDLMWEADLWWLRPRTKEPSGQFLDNEPKNVVSAFPVPSNANSALIFLVPVLSLLACIPAALAWVHSSHQTGTIDDADFYQLISGSSMQFLGILTMIIPTLSNARLVGQAWIWTWVLAGLSMACSIVAIPIYLFAQTEWSGAVLFAGSVLQTFVTLQLMFAI